MADFTLFHLLITSSVWHSDDKTLRVWITLLGVSHGGIARIAVKPLSLSARVSEDECRAALKILSQPDADSRGTDNEGRRIERVDGGYKILNAAAYLQLMRDEQQRIRDPHDRKEYMRKYMQERRAKNGTHAAPPAPAATPPAPKDPPPNFSPPTIADALQFAQEYNNGQGLTRNLKITPEVVHAWHDDRASLGWTVVKHQTQILLSDWKSDLPKYAATWKRNEGSDLFRRGAGNKAGSAGSVGALNRPNRYASSPEDR